jgi:hypothetical protein
MSTSVPSNFPEELTGAAFVNGEEVAWEQKDCLTAINWLFKNGYAVLGFELWLPEDDGIRTAISTKAGPAVYASGCNRKKGEIWEDYVQRSTRAAAERIGAFRWFEDALEPARPAYFNLTWSDKEWFEKSIEDAEHTSDK